MDDARRRRSRSGPYLPVIDGILDVDRRARRKQWHTAKRIFDRLREEHGFDCGYTTAKDYVRLKRLKMKEAVVPSAHPPGHARVDFGEALAIAGSTTYERAAVVG